MMRVFNSMTKAGQALVHKSNALIIGREISTLAEMGKKLHIRRKGIERITLLSLGRENCGQQQKNQ